MSPTKAKPGQPGDAKPTDSSIQSRTAGRMAGLPKRFKCLKLFVNSGQGVVLREIA